MPDEKPESAVESVAEEKTAKGHVLECPRCGGNDLKRVKRAGFVQERVYPIFGYYPWKCTKCLGNVLLKKRGQAKRRRVDTDQPETAGAIASNFDQA